MKKPKPSGSKVKFKLSNKSVPLGIFNSTHIEIIGMEELIIEGCRGIIEYDADSIRLNGGKAVVLVRGDKLDMCSMGEESAVIRGRIYSVEFI